MVFRFSPRVCAAEWFSAFPFLCGFPLFHSSVVFFIVLSDVLRAFRSLPVQVYIYIYIYIYKGAQRQAATVPIKCNVKRHARLEIFNLALWKQAYADTHNAPEHGRTLQNFIDF